jgi:hypothetical protein
MDRKSTLFILLLLVGCASNKTPLPPVDGASKTLSRSSFRANGSVDRVGSYSPLTSATMSIPAADVIISGWAVDDRSSNPAAGVDVVIDEKPYRANYGEDRPDVARALNAPSCAKSGYTFVLHAGQFPKGRHTVVIRVISADNKTFAEMIPLTLQIN